MPGGEDAEVRARDLASADPTAATTISLIVPLAPVAADALLEADPAAVELLLEFVDAGLGVGAVDGSGDLLGLGATTCGGPTTATGHGERCSSQAAMSTSVAPPSEG